MAGLPCRRPGQRFSVRGRAAAEGWLPESGGTRPCGV